MADLFTSIDVSDWPGGGDETMGSKTKDWLRSPDQAKWLFKYRAKDYTGDDWSEKLAAAVAAILGVPHATVELAIRNGSRGVVSRDLVGQHGAAELVPGDRLLDRHIPGYPDGNAYRRKDHTLERVLTVLETASVGVPPGCPSDPAFQDGCDVFVGYLMLDARIGNVDRNPGNWAALVYSTVTVGPAVRLCPSYDHASCLGYRESDSGRATLLAAPDGIKQYAARAKSALYSHEPAGRALSPMTAFRAAGATRPAALAAWLGRLAGVDLARLTDLVSGPPAGIMSELAREFAALLMTVNLAEN